MGTCAVLGKVLQSTDSISKVSFEDCLVEEDHLKALLLGMCGNSSVTTLSLKGNNIHGQSALAVAKMIKCNKGVVRLTLEWNNFGTNKETFSSVCESLATNSSLEYVDLRSNQLGIDCTHILCKALVRNNSLVSVDLRWNSIGAIGGKALLDCLKHNKNLRSLNLTGNGVPNDIIAAIEYQLAQNSRTNALTGEYVNRTELLKTELQERELVSSMKIKQLEESLVNTDLTLNKALRDSAFHAGELEEELRSKVLEVESLEAKLELVKSALNVSQERVSSLEQRTSSLQQDLKKAKEETMRQSRSAQEELLSTKAEYEREVNSLKDVNNRLQAQVNELEYKTSSNATQMLDMKEMICSLQSEVKGARVECESQISQEKMKHKEVLRTMEQQQLTEVQHLKSEHQRLENELWDQIRGAESHRGELESELVSLRTQLSTERTTSQAQLKSQKQQMKLEHKSALRELQEKIEYTEQSLQDAEERLHQESIAHANLQGTNTKMNSQIHTLKNQVTQLDAKLSGKDEEVKVAEARVRLEVKHQLEELEINKQEVVKLNATIKKLERSLEENQLEFENDLKKKDEEVRKAKQEVKEKEVQLLRLREDEVRRMGMLHSAFMAYFNTSTSSTPFHQGDG
ncbi:leucine-rich repeat-containing protein 45-like isoform X2 [Oratosquilla oratoria]